MDLPQLGSFAQEVLLNAFRTHYHPFQAAVTDLVGTQTDVIVISRLGDDLDEFADIVTEASIQLWKINISKNVIQSAAIFPLKNSLHWRQV